MICLTPDSRRAGAGSTSGCNYFSLLERRRDYEPRRVDVRLRGRVLLSIHGRSAEHRPGRAHLS